MQLFFIITLSVVKIDVTDSYIENKNILYLVEKICMYFLISERKCKEHTFMYLTTCSLINIYIYVFDYM